MSLSVGVLHLAPLPIVRVLVSGVPAGTAWNVAGSAGGQDWLAGEGVSDGGEVMFADPWAPLGVPVVYTLTAGATVEASSPVVRDYRGQSALTDLSGRVVVDFLWVRDGGDSRDWEPRSTFLEVDGSHLPVGMYSPVAGAGGGSVTARTVMPHTDTMRGLVRSNRPLVLLHNHGRRCQLRGCDVPLSRTVMLTAASEGLSSRTDRAERIWDLSYRLVSRPHGYLAPVASWADVAARWTSAAAMVAGGRTNADVARGGWMVGW